MISQKEIYKKEIEKALKFLENEPSLKGYSINENDKVYYTFIIKHIIFFKIYYEKVNDKYAYNLISDLFFYIKNEIKNEIRNNMLIERSIIENYIRLAFDSYKKIPNITKSDLDELSNIEEMEVKNRNSIIVSSYKVACNYIHGGDLLEKELVIFMKDLFNTKKKNKRKSSREKTRKRNLIKSLDYLLFIKNFNKIDDAFHRNKVSLYYLITSKDIHTLVDNKLKE